jgi:hypothetical protein
MPIIIENNNYSNAFGYSGTTYTSNAGDKTTLELTVAELIRVTTLSNPFSFDPILNVLTSPSVSWVAEGFRVGDIVKITRYDNVGAVITTHEANVTSITASALNVDSWATNLFYDISANDIMEIVPLVTSGGAVRRRDDLLIEFNHALNDQIGSSASLIDGEKTQIFYSGLSSLVGTQSGAMVGNQSGQFLISSNIEYIGLNSDNFHQYTLTFEFVNSGLYNPDWFALGDCLKVFIRGLWSSLSGEVFNRTEFTLDEQANTGFIGEANNISVPTGGSVVTGITDLKFNEVNNVVFEVNLNGTDINDLAIGGAYLSIDDSYYKNKPTSQTKLTYLLPTTIISAPNTYTSEINSGGQWEITINSITPSGGNAIIDADIEFNGTLQTFLDARLDDRLFYFWVKIGNTNHFLYNAQVDKSLEVGGALIMNSDFGFIDHAQNVTSATGDLTGFSADIEDDVAYYGTFNLEKNKTSYENINLRVEAYNTVTDETFTLQQTNFSFNSVIYQNSTGKFLLNLSATINNDLLNTSEKKNALVQLTGVEDVSTYEVSVYYPFILNWRYWLTLSGVNSDFAPNYNQDWLPYGNTGDWTVRFTVDLVDDGLTFTHSNEITINDYDANSDINSSLVLKKQSDNSVVSYIPEGELLYIESTHEKTSGNWDFQKVWGQITVEPKEGAPRWMLSTIIDYDNNINNPLSPISGLNVSFDIISANILKFSCKFDAGKLDTSNGVKITAKVKEGNEDIVIVNKITNDNEDKITTDDELKIIA